MRKHSDCSNQRTTKARVDARTAPGVRGCDFASPSVSGSGRHQHPCTLKQAARRNDSVGRYATKALQHLELSTITDEAKGHDDPPRPRHALDRGASGGGKPQCKRPRRLTERQGAISNNPVSVMWKKRKTIISL